MSFSFKIHHWILLCFSTLPLLWVLTLPDQLHRSIRSGTTPYIYTYTRHTKCHLTAYHTPARLHSLSASTLYKPSLIRVNSDKLPAAAYQPRRRKSMVNKPQKSIKA